MHWLAFLPETVLLISSLVLLILALAKEELTQKILYPFIVTMSVVLLGACSFSATSAQSLFYDTYQVDLLSQGFKWLLSLAFLFTILLSKDIRVIGKKRHAEYYFLLSTSLLGLMMITSAVDLLTLYISMELSSYSLYLLSALKEDKRSAEAGMKYLIFGAAASGVFLWGASLLTGLAGTTSFFGPHFTMHTNFGAIFTLGLVFVSFSFLFKLSGFPLHFWAPDVYESSATPITNFIATASKGAAVAILIRVLMLISPPANFIFLLGILALISMTLGNVVALVQKDVKRLLAYSSIAQAGYILVGLLAVSEAGFSAVFFYALAYILMNTGAFLVTVCVAQNIGHDNPRLSDFDGLAERSGFLALILLLSLLSLAGIPPLVGFTGKWILFSAAMDQGHWFLVLWAVLNSVVSLFYYLTLVKHAYLEKPKITESLKLPFHVQALGLVLVCALVFLGIFPNAFITFAQNAVTSGTLR